MQAQKDISEIKEEAALLNQSLKTLQRETDEKFDQIFLAMGVDTGIGAPAAERSCRTSPGSNAAGVMDHGSEVKEDLIGKH